MARKKRCAICGYDGGWRPFYAYKAPHCEAEGVHLCEECHTESGGETKGIIFQTRKCSVCSVGEMKSCGLN